MSGQPVDLSPLQRELDTLKRVLCHCGYQNTCLGCQGIEVLRQQAQMVVAAASQPVLMQVAQEAAAKDLVGQMQALQERLLADPEARRLLEELLRGFGTPPEQGR
jgi:hypothetical protein